MPAVRALCRPDRQNPCILAKFWQSTTSRFQMRQVSGGPTAGPSVPLALDLPPAHTSRGTLRLRVHWSRQHAARHSFPRFRCQEYKSRPQKQLSPFSDQSSLQMCASLELFGHHSELSKGPWHLYQQPIWEQLPSKVSLVSPCCAAW